MIMDIESIVAILCLLALLVVFLKYRRSIVFGLKALFLGAFILCVLVAYAIVALAVLLLVLPHRFRKLATEEA